MSVPPPSWTPNSTLDRIRELVRKIDDRRVEADELRLDDRQRRHDGREDLRSATSI